VLVKVNQIGTLTETLGGAGPGPLSRLSHGHLGPAAAKPRTAPSPTSQLVPEPVQIKIGSVVRGERLAKYNQLLRIEEEMGESAVFAGGEW